MIFDERYNDYTDNALNIHCFTPATYVVGRFYTLYLTYYASKVLNYFIKIQFLIMKIMIIWSEIYE
jgi:hypothetical protein